MCEHASHPLLHIQSEHLLREECPRGRTRGNVASMDTVRTFRELVLCCAPGLLWTSPALQILGLGRELHPSLAGRRTTREGVGAGEWVAVPVDMVGGRT